MPMCMHLQSTHRVAPLPLPAVRPPRPAWRSQWLVAGECGWWSSGCRSEQCSAVSQVSVPDERAAISHSACVPSMRRIADWRDAIAVTENRLRAARRIRLSHGCSSGQADIAARAIHTERCTRRARNRATTTMKNKTKKASRNLCPPSGTAPRDNRASRTNSLTTKVFIQYKHVLLHLFSVPLDIFFR